ncbi:molybdenum cofactor guanylyltransferase [Methylobacillus flagellatus]|uniref:molybdenum cofactor guanylyltransferase MobA n=1 Tax=Methylobacillus flagellatus TaxID=405 RepID=UPI002853BBB3|nr:molybdenum cofactor guanylyltransferase MobA [Methylobacillus flagellatus]MDR5172316.1 molybdenum cofactor guanylyltransferase [Methylobacillus flagellatus]
MSITGIVLAGGKGKRMGGADKGLVEFNGQPMVAHVLRRLAPQVDEVLVNANREIERYNQLGYRVIEDEISGFAGPLAGLHAGMQHAQHPYILTVPCDSPLLPPSLAKRLMNALIERDADIAVAKTGKQAHPVFSLCRRALLPSLGRFLERGERKMADWIAELDSIEVSFTDQALAFTNLNTPEELRGLEQAA